MTNQPVEQVRIAPTGNDEEIAAAAAELERTHREVADAAGHWVSVGCPSVKEAERGGSMAAWDLRNAVNEWRAAGERLVRAMRGGRS